MKNYLPTRDECQALISSSDAFFCTTTDVEGQLVEMYNYRLAGYSDFFPEDGSNWSELRGLTFVQQADGSWGRNILLQKFFNINQTTDWMYDDVKDKKITRVQNKEDGSVISFVRFTNGNIRAKSKMSFTSPQAEMAQEVFMNNFNVRKFVTICLNSNLVPIFELVSPDNQIVLKYLETELMLLQVRQAGGTYLSGSYISNLLSSNITMAENFDIQNIILPELSDGESILDFFINAKNSQAAIEGWVVTFEDGQMAKIKTDKYLRLHGLVGPDIFRENLLVQTILDGNVDDVIAALVPGAKKDKLVDMSSSLEHHFNHLVVEFKELRRKYFQDFNEVRKDFAIKHSKDSLFGSVMKTLNTSFKDVEKTAEAAVKGYILKQCKGLNDAKLYIKGISND